MGRLAEDYDGIGQYVLISLSQSSVSVAYKARIAAGDFGGGRRFPKGTKVPVISIRGQLEVLLGNHPRILACCTDLFARDIPAFTTWGRHEAWGRLPGCDYPWELRYTSGIDTSTSNQLNHNPPDTWIEPGKAIIRGRQGAALLPFPPLDPFHSSRITRAGIYLNPFQDTWPELFPDVAVPLPITSLIKLSIFLPTITGPGTNPRQLITYKFDWEPTWENFSGTSVGFRVSHNFNGSDREIVVILSHTNGTTQLSYVDDLAARTFYTGEIVDGGVYPLWIRVRHEGAVSYMKAWKDGDSEPSNWATIETTESQGSWVPRFYVIEQSSTAALNAPAPQLWIHSFELCEGVQSAA